MTVTLPQLQRMLRSAQATVAVAESVTAGLVAAALTETPGASHTFRGGVVVYATELKATLGGVDPALLRRHGPVSPQVAEALATAVRQRLGATYGVSVTGVAGPEPQGGQDVGTVYVGVAAASSVRVERFVLAGSRAEIRAGAVAAALALLAAEVGAAPVR